jgi:hypothetical protein
VAAFFVFTGSLAGETGVKSEILLVYVQYCRNTCGNREVVVSMVTLFHEKVAIVSRTSYRITFFQLSWSLVNPTSDCFSFFSAVTVISQLGFLSKSGSRASMK